jgi:putative sigma-54 modulation protein
MEIIMQSVHFDADVKLQEFIEKKLRKLENFFDHIVSADVILKMENSGQIKDKIAEIKLNVPGSTLLAKETCKTFEEAIDLSADALRRQLQKYKDRNIGH